ncbi:YsnF/AvaK domain-containing protein [Paracoccus sp. T5]|uniref:YsnF/AvaK domain-containing protein n=1 Tax=Paracoccus sp. T5 TaxID=3402161 RepID=UPI003AE54A45
MRDKNIDSQTPGGPDADSNDSGRNVELRLPLAEERVVIDKREVEKLAAHISLRTRSEDVTVTEPLRTERVEVRRVPVDRLVANAPETRVEGDMTIIPVVEEVLVVQYRIVEEVQIIRHVESVEHAETVTLRRQEAFIDNPDSDDLPHDPPAEDGSP